ncbi:alpha/beta fold hydrolase [Pseudomonas sp. SWRI10]|uniref:Alpha/beta fold hydrolase n=1 Tax=Pseudomonas urmiensis TaxID=2745493 RepID=A0A923FV92_9PSED|nr:alpha/beta fold hydrolase [Pseudomonas urmiensis]
MQTTRSTRGNDVIIFIHGLSGSSGTWDQMLKVLIGYRDLDHIGYDCYQYPTQLWRGPFGKKMSSIQEISEGLKTFIASKHKGKNILIVAHSLGGVIARHYILESMKFKRDHYVTGLLLYASPLAGAGLANLASRFSWRHPHLKQLSVKADLLTSMNGEWVALDVASSIKVRSVIAGSDSVVSRESSSPYVGDQTTDTLIEYGHINITKPDNAEDLRFKILRDFISQWTPDSSLSGFNPNNFSASDILFDAYSTRVEKFYVPRAEDQVIAAAANASNIWLSGPPGVGKTAALKRLITKEKWKFHHLILDSFRDVTAADLMREICNALNESAGVDKVLPRGLTDSDLVKAFKKAIASLANNQALALLVEEIPLASGAEYNKFIDYCYRMTLECESIHDNCRVIWLFSSIKDPTKDLKECTAKLYEKIQFIGFGAWRDTDITTLISMINTNLSTGFSPEDVGLIVSSCNGSPRFVKMLFRSTRNEIGGSAPLRELLGNVKRDVVT